MQQSHQSEHKIALATGQRIDIYASIHKALRMFMCDTLCLLGSMDAGDAREIADGLAQLRELTALCRSHLQHENRFVHAAMEARSPGSTAVIDDEHEQHERALDQLEDLANAAEQGDGNARGVIIATLYRHLALFVAENLVHMNIEETAHNAVLWENYSDEEILGIEQALVASIPPQESLLVMRWMIPAMNAAECAQKLSGIRDHAPAPVFDALLAIARERLPEQNWRKLADATGTQTSILVLQQEHRAVDA